MNITGGFSITTSTGSTIRLSVWSIRNPRSRTPTFSFKAYIIDPNGYGQYTVESGKTIEMTSSADYSNIELSRSNTVNGVVTSYIFTITLNNLIQNGDYIRVNFPSELTLHSTTNQ